MKEPHSKARTTDPQTSFDAALRATEPTKLRAGQARVLNMFKLYGDMHDKQLQDYLHDAERGAGMKLMSDSGVRTRRSELSKPNMDRIAEIICEITGIPSIAAVDLKFAEERGVVEDARKRLRIEGFRSPLWDTGRREVVDGHQRTIWGLAV